MHSVFEQEYLEKKYESKFVQGREIYKDDIEECLISRPAWAFEEWLTLAGYKEAVDDICPIEQGVVYGATDAYDLVETFIQYFSEYEEFEHEIKEHAAHILPQSNIGYLANQEILEKQDYYNYLVTRHMAEFDEFYHFLSKFPLLGFKHPIGRQIYSIIEGSQGIEIKQSWWRGRGTNEDCTDDIYPMEISQTEGRFNHYGTNSSLYLSDTRMGCYQEIKKECSFLHLSNINVNESNVLDITEGINSFNEDGNELLTFGILYDKLHLDQGKGKENVKLFNPGYVVSRYFADCARELRFNGIKYRNVRGPGIYNNLVLFRFMRQRNDIEHYRVNEILE